MSRTAQRLGNVHTRTYKNYAHLCNNGTLELGYRGEYIPSPEDHRSQKLSRARQSLFYFIGRRKYAERLDH